MRVEQQAAFILHHRPFRDTSQILDIVTREHGRLAVVARGSRAQKSRLRGVLRPFLPLSISWVQRSDLGTLTGAEMGGRPVQLNGDALLAGYYVNELLLHFLHRHDAQPEIFDLYVQTVNSLCATSNVAASVRHFEMELLRQLGYALNLEHEAVSHQPLQDDSYYEFRFEQGPVTVAHTDGRLVFSGAVLTGIAKRQFEDAGILKAANRLLREVIAFHLGGKELKSRKVLLELRRQRGSAS